MIQKNEIISEFESSNISKKMPRILNSFNNHQINKSLIFIEV